MAGFWKLLSSGESLESLRHLVAGNGSTSGVLPHFHFSEHLGTVRRGKVISMPHAVSNCGLLTMVLVLYTAEAFSGQRTAAQELKLTGSRSKGLERASCIRRECIIEHGSAEFLVKRLAVCVGCRTGAKPPRTFCFVDLYCFALIVLSMDLRRSSAGSRPHLLVRL